MDKGQADMVIKDDNLADACADRSSSPVIIIAETSRVSNLCGIGRYGRDEVAQFQNDIPDLGRDMAKIMDNTGRWEHCL